MDIDTIVSVGTLRPGNKPQLPNITLQKAVFFGKPNFAGEVDRFGEDGRKFTVLIPNETADTLRQLNEHGGYMVKTNIPTKEELEQFPDRGEVSHLKVAVDDKSDVWLRMGAEGIPERLDLRVWGIVDKSRIQEMDMEIRAWNYNEKKIDAGVDTERMWSARLVKIIVTIEHNILDAKYGGLI